MKYILKYCGYALGKYKTPTWWNWINLLLLWMHNHMQKKHLHTLSLWHIILKHLSIKALTLDIPWHILDKNYIDLWLLWMYILMQKNNLVTKLLLSYRIFKNIGLWLVNTKMDMPYHEQAETLNHTIMSSHTIMSRSMFNIA